MDKTTLSESDICDQYITPAIVAAGWDMTTQIRREFGFTAGRIIVRGQDCGSRPAQTRRLSAVLSAATCPSRSSRPRTTTTPSVVACSRHWPTPRRSTCPSSSAATATRFVFHDRTGLTHPVESTLSLHEFPSPGQLWSRYRAWKGLSDEAEKLVRFPYHDDGSGKEPRYYQRIAIQRTIEAIARGERRVLLAMATGTG